MFITVTQQCLNLYMLQLYNSDSMFITVIQQCFNVYYSYTTVSQSLPDYYKCTTVTHSLPDYYTIVVGEMLTDRLLIDISHLMASSCHVVCQCLCVGCDCSIEARRKTPRSTPPHTAISAFSIIYQV